MTFHFVSWVILKHVSERIQCGSLYPPLPDQWTSQFPWGTDRWFCPPLNTMTLPRDTTTWFSDLVDLWVIKVEKPMILCAPSTSRRRWHRKGMQKVCLFYSQNNKIGWLPNMKDSSLKKLTRYAKVCGLFPWLYYKMFLLSRSATV